MTLIKIHLQKPGPLGLVAARGSTLWSPSKRLNLDHAVEVPDPFRVRLGDLFAGHTQEAGVAWVEVAPNGPDWAWKVWEKVQGGGIRYVNVPNQPTGFIEYDDLEDVDPATLSPTAAPSAAWWTKADDLQAQIDSITVGGVTDAAIAALITGPGLSRDAVEGVVDDKTTLTPSAMLLFENALL